MKPHRKGKIDSVEFSRLREIGYNYHKFLWTKFKRRIRTKRLKDIKGQNKYNVRSSKG